MIERTQPVVKGLKNGELMWVIMPMPRWQMEMFRVKYVGDFMAHWIKKQFEDITGHEMGEGFNSMELRAHSHYAKQRWIHPGD